MATDKEINEKSKRQISLPLLILGVAGAIVLIAGGGIIYPKYLSISTLKTQIEEEEQNHALIDAQAKQLKKEKDKIEQREQEMIEMNIKKKTIPNGFQIDKLLETLDFYTHESKGFRLQQIDFGPLVPVPEQQNLSGMMITLVIQSPASKQIELVNDLENDEQIFIVEDIQIVETTEKDADAPQVTIKLKTFYNTSPNV